MDKIIMKNLALFGYHGVLQEEKTLGQKFFIDIDIYCDLYKAGISDDVKDTINYAEVYDLVKEIVEEEKFNLLEALGENIADRIFQRFIQAKELVIVIRKPEAPVKGIFDYFGIEIRRTRND